MEHPKPPSPPAGGLDVKLGTVVELSRDELREIHNLTRELERLSRFQRPGWLARYVPVLTRLNRTLRRAVERSHAS